MRLHRLLFLLTFLIALSVCPSAHAVDFTGQVVGIIDGDTIEVMHLGKAERVRLYGVDCPEIGQPFGEKAKQYTTTHTFRKTVQVVVMDQDRNGLTLGQIVLPDMSNLNIVLVSAGLAWWHETNSPEDEILKDIQRNAKAAKRGLWVDPHPIPPWEFRRGKKD